MCQRGIRMNSLKKKKYPCFANPDVFRLDHKVHLFKHVKITEQVKSQILLEKLLVFFFKFPNNASVKQDFKVTDS
jgi:hypothetical protein